MFLKILSYEFKLLQVDWEKTYPAQMNSLIDIYMRQ